jgi:hypothetical protein
VVNKFNLQSKPRLQSHSYTWQYATRLTKRFLFLFPHLFLFISVFVFLFLSLFFILLLWFYSPLLGLGRFFSFLILYTVGRTPWTGDQSVARPLPIHRINAHNTDIHALSGIRTHDLSVRASEDSSWLRPRSHCDRPAKIFYIYFADGRV